MSVMQQIREALADAVDPVIKATGGGQALAYANFDSPTAPVIQVAGTAGGSMEATEGTFGRPGAVYRISLQGLTGTASDEESQRRMDTWLDESGDLSVREAVEADQTLGGVTGVWGVEVESTSGYQLVDVPGGPRFLGCEWIVRVHVT